MLADGLAVVVFDDLITGRHKNIEHLLDNPNFTFVEQDVSVACDVKGSVDYVMHLASPASPNDFKRIPIETLRAGSFATHVMLDLARRKGARFFLASTSEIYGDPPPEHHPQVETYFGNVNPNGPRSVYDEAKRYAEAVTMAYHRQYDLDTRIVRIFNTYGPRMRPNDGRVVPAFIKQALMGEPLTLFGDGHQTRSFCYVSDLIRGIYALALSSAHEPVNIGNPREMTVVEFARKILGLTGSG
ncbi:MAG: NAD-dependent epimerase/dehydratase family protein, partial [Candidatus Hydrogenedentes bacterium]|nr:NAD-dependent epimerase/dehydratase family protein [Candidatus Hydrogenedentota bacterium]